MVEFRHHKAQGFTLIELIVTVTIISVLVAAGAVSYTTVTRRSRDAKRKSDVEQLRSALEMYRADFGYYPTAGSGSWTAASNLTGDLVTTYMPAIPNDPKVPTFAYRYQATNLTGGNYFGYCLTTYLETVDETDSCTPDNGAQPSGSFMYGIKNP
jgi:general secretion pathway protein G